MLAAIRLYRLPDFIMVRWQSPIHDLGLAKQTVGAVRGSIGSSPRLQASRGGRILPLKLATCAPLVIVGHCAGSRDRRVCVLSRSRAPSIPSSRWQVGDNFGLSFAGVYACCVHVEFTSLGYTATQYAS